MQVNLNPSVNHYRPQFKALKDIKFNGRNLQNCARAQKELLTIFDNPKIDKLFKKYDGNVEFYADSTVLTCRINIFVDIDKKFSKIKQEYIEKAKRENIPTHVFENVKFTPIYQNGKYCYLSERTPICCADKLQAKSKDLAKIVQEMTDERKNSELEAYFNSIDSEIREGFESIIKTEIKERKDKANEIRAKEFVDKKLKDLLGNK